MPAFFFISGFLEGEKRRSISEKKQAIVKKVKRLMVPYFFLTVVTALLKLLFGAFARNPLNYSTLAVDVLIGRNNPNGGLWFLYALFVISIFGILFDTINRTTLTGTMFVLYMLNTIVFKQSGYVVGFFLSYAWIYFMGGAVRKHIYEKIKNLSINIHRSGYGDYMIFLEKLKESSISVLPIMALVSLLHFALAPLGVLFVPFLLGGILIIAGLSFFLVGADIGVLPMGQRAGSALVHKRSLPLLLGAG